MANVPNRSLSPLARTFGALVGMQVINRVIRALYLLVLARLLSQEELGIYIYGLAVYLSLVIFANLGQGTLLKSRLSRRPATAHGLMCHSLTFRVFGIVVVTSAGLGFAWIHEDQVLVSQVVTWFLATLVVRSLTEWIRHCYVALEDASWIPRYELIFRGGEALCGTLLLLAGAGLLTICSLHFAAWAIEALFSYRRLRQWSARPLRFGTTWRFLKAILPISLTFAATAGLMNLYGHIGIVLLRHLQPDPAIVGYFGIAMQLLLTFLLIPVALGGAVIPALGRVRRGESHKEISALATIVKAGLIVGGITAILANAYAVAPITALLGPDYAPAAECFALACWALGPYGVAIVTSQTLNALERRGQATMVAAAMVVLHIALIVAFKPFGVLFAATASLLAASIVGCLLGTILLGRRIETLHWRWWVPPLALVLIQFIVMLQLEAAMKLWLAPVLILLSLVLIWRTKVFSRSELSMIGQRFGIRAKPQAI